MPKSCSPEYLANGSILGLLDSMGAIHSTGGQFDTMAKRWAEDNRIYLEYERVRFNLEHGGEKRATYQALLEDNFPKGKTGDFKELFNLIRPWYSMAPTEVFGKTFIDPLAKRLRAFNKDFGDVDLKTYRTLWKDRISPIAEGIQVEMLRASNTLPGPKKEAFYKERFGLELNQVHDAMDYLEWLRKGGPTQAPPNTEAPKKLLEKGLRNFSGSLSRMNTLWTMYNIGDIARIANAATFRSPTGGVLPILRAAYTTVKNNPFKTIKELGNVTAGDYLREQNPHFFEPFHASTVAQKNFAYNLDKELGGDGFGLLSSHVFDYENWNAPAMYRSGSQLENSIFRLGRYMLAESNYLTRLTARAVGAEGIKKAPQAAAELAMFMGTRAVLYGLPAIIPAEVAILLKENMGDDDYQEMVDMFNELPAANLAGKTTQWVYDGLFGKGVVKETVGRNTSISLVQVPILGAGLKAYSAGGEKVIDESLESLASVADFDKPLPSKMAHAAGVYMAALNLTSNNALLNNTTSTKMLFALADYLDDDVKLDKANVGMAKAIFGANTAKKGKKGK